MTKELYNRYNKYLNAIKDADSVHLLKYYAKMLDLLTNQLRNESGEEGELTKSFIFHCMGSTARKVDKDFNFKEAATDWNTQLATEFRRRVWKAAAAFGNEEIDDSQKLVLLSQVTRSIVDAIENGAISQTLYYATQIQGSSLRKYFTINGRAAQRMLDNGEFNLDETVLEPTETTGTFRPNPDISTAEGQQQWLAELLTIQKEFWQRALDEYEALMDKLNRWAEEGRISKMGYDHVKSMVLTNCPLRFVKRDKSNFGNGVDAVANAEGVKVGKVF